MAVVLIIDDDPRILDLWATALTMDNFTVLVAASGARGLEIARTEPVDVVITDIIMPDMDGIEILLELKAFHPDTKVIAVSGGSQLLGKSYLEVADKLGADIVLQKPVTIDRLCRAVRRFAKDK